MANDNDELKPLSFDENSGETLKPLSFDTKKEQGSDYVPLSKGTANEIKNKDSNFVFFFRYCRVRKISDSFLNAILLEFTSRGFAS